MKDFNTKRFFVAVISVYIVKQVLDIAIHGKILESVYQSLSDVWRPDMEEKMWVMWLTSLIFSIFFVYIYHFFQKGHFKKGLATGLCYGFLMGFLIEGGNTFNSYALYELPASLVWQWFIYGMIQMIIYGLVVAWIYKSKESEL